MHNNYFKIPLRKLITPIAINRVIVKTVSLNKKNEKQLNWIKE